MELQEHKGTEQRLEAKGSSWQLHSWLAAGAHGAVARLPSTEPAQLGAAASESRGAGGEKIIEL